MATVEVQLTNQSDQTVGLRVDEDSDAFARIQKRGKVGELDVHLAKGSGRRSTRRKPPVDVDETSSGGDGGGDGSGD